MNIKTEDYKNGFEISLEDSWVRIRACDDTLVSIDLLISTLKKLFSMDAYRNAKAGSLCDFRKCRSDLDFKKMNTLKLYAENHFDKNLKHRFIAIVVDRDLLFGLARMFQMLFDKPGVDIRIFRDMGQAETWLKREIDRYGNKNNT